MHKTAWRRVLATAAVAAGLLAVATAASAASAQDAPAGHTAVVVRGGGTTIIEAGTGAPDFIPVITTFGFHAEGGQGSFECLAFLPNTAPGEPGSGDFDTQIMYVTGTITSTRATGDGTVILRGTATVTGVGAGENEPFVATVRAGGPGTPFTLEVSGLTFKEIVTEGEISISRR